MVPDRLSSWTSCICTSFFLVWENPWVAAFFSRHILLAQHQPRQGTHEQQPLPHTTPASSSRFSFPPGSDVDRRTTVGRRDGELRVGDSRTVSPLRRTGSFPWTLVFSFEKTTRLLDSSVFRLMRPEVSACRRIFLPLSHVILSSLIYPVFLQSCCNACCCR